MQEIAILLKEYRAENDNLLISDAQKLISGITEDAGDNPSFYLGEGRQQVPQLFVR